MAQALVTGTGPAADAVAAALAAQGWQLRRAETAVGAELAGSETLLACVAPAGGDAMAELCLAPARLAAAMAAHLPDPARDAGGELRASGQVLLVLARPALVPGLAPDGLAAAQAAALAWMRAAALSLAPRLRLNALALDPAAPGDPAPLLAWLTAAHAVTGQVLCLGPEPRLAAPWLAAGRRQPAGAAV